MVWLQVYSCTFFLPIMSPEAHVKDLVLLLCCQSADSVNTLRYTPIFAIQEGSAMISDVILELHYLDS